MTDLSQTSGNVEWNSGTNQKTGIAGEAITAGEPVYISSSDGRLYAAEAGDTAAKAAAVGIATATAEKAGAIISYAPPGANIDVGASTTQAEVYVVSATAGGIAPVADLVEDDYVTVLFVGTGSSDVTVLDGVSGVQHPA